MADTYSFDKSYEYFQRAVKVVPGGVYGSKAPAFVVPGSYPYFITHGEGAHIFDVDKNEYIDFLCGFGTNILGYGYKRINDVVAKRVVGGEVFNVPSPEFVELAELLVDQVDDMDWALIGKNGTDMTTFAVTMARMRSNKKKIIMAKGAYHGTAPWAAPSDHAAIDDKKDVLKFTYNDLDELKGLFQKYKGQIAAIMLSPYHHPAFGDSVMPTDDFYPTVEKLCKEEDALFIMDDIRCNFRINLHGSHLNFDNCHPDVITMGKSLGNGHPVSAVLGRGDLYTAASKVYATGTFWFGAGALAAAIETVKTYNELDTITHMNKMGQMLKDGLYSLAKDAGMEINVTGALTIPFMSFKDDPDFYLNQVFCAEATKRGVYLHPHHNWFIAYAHTEADINKALDVCKIAFEKAKEAKDA